MISAFIRDRLPAWARSRTLWFSVALAALGAVEMQAQVIPEEWRGHVLILVAAVSAVLRFATTMPVSEK
jgi:hypothetical protein